MHNKLYRLFTATFALVLAVSLAAPICLNAAKDTNVPKSKGKARADLAVISRMFTTTNNIIFGVDNRGNLGKDPGGSSTTGGGYWRSRTDQYVFQSGLHVAGVFDGNGNGVLADTVETEAVYDEEWREGLATNSQDDAINRLYNSTNTTDLDEWPDYFRDENGDPKIFGQQDIVTFYTDVKGPVNSAAGRFRLGVQVYQRVKLFSVTSQKDIMYVQWDFQNASQYINDDVNGDGSIDVSGPYTINGMLAVVNTDFDIGDADDDRAAVSPLLNMAIYWDSNFSEANFNNTPGFLGIKFLDSPAQVGRPADGVDNDGDGQVDEADEPNRIGLTGFTITTNRGGPREDPNTDAEAYRIMTNQPGEVTEPAWDPEADLIVSDFEDDLRARLLTGPFDLPADGNIQTVEVGYLLANTLRATPDPTDITLAGELTNLVGLAQTVQTTFDTDFNLPAPPVSPNLKLIERDGSVVVTWDDLSEKTPDTFYPVSQVATNPDGTPAATYNPDYLEMDFQGYRVYRSLTPETDDAVLVAQFDLVDGITTSSAAVGADAGVDVDGDGSPEAYDPFDVGFKGDDDAVDTGIKYIFVDRGQGLSTREGLINGIKYYYAVTAFDYQPSNTGQESLESGVQLIALNSDGFNVREGIPQTMANGFQQAKVNGSEQVYPDGTVIGDPPVLTLDENGMLVGDTPQQASNALSITDVVIADGAKMPSEIKLMVDSVTLVDDDFDASLGIYNDAWYNVYLSAVDMSLGTVIGTTVLSTAGYDPWGADYQMEGTINIWMDGNVIGAIDVSLWVDQWDGLVVEPIQISGAMQYDNVQQGHQRTQLTDYFYWLYGWSDYAYGFDPITGVGEDGAMPFLTSGGNIGHLVGGIRDADIEIKWVDAGGGDLTLEVTDLSNKVDVRFSERANDTWGFVPSNKTSLDFMIDHQPAQTMFDDFWASETPGVDLIATQMTLADGSTRPYAVDDGRRNLNMVNRLNLALKPSDYDMLGRELTDADGAVVDEMGDHIADLTGTQDLDLYVCGVLVQVNGITALPSAGDTWKLRIRQHPSPAQNPYRGGSDFPGTANFNHYRVVAGNQWMIDLSPESLDLTKRDLSRIKVVPNPYIASSPLDLSPDDRTLHFNHLPGDCVIRIYTVAGQLVDTIEHALGTGTAAWDLRSRYNQKVASGYYIYHVTDNETGETHMGKFAIIQ